MELLQLKKFADPQTLAEHFARQLIDWIKERDSLHVALSGGSTPKLLFRILAKEQDVDWSKVHLYWGDERCVAPDDVESNYKMTKDLLLDRISMPVENIHRIRGEADPEEEAQRYAQLVQDQLPITNGLPVFDLIILGMGGDGHTASIFPHQMELLTAPSNCAVASHPVSGQRRVSLTGRVLNNAKQVAFLITGAGKREVFNEILHRRGVWRSYPTSHIQPAGELSFYVDRFVLEEPG